MTDMNNAAADSAARKDSKTLEMAAKLAIPKPGSRIAKTFAFGRDILRSPLVLQAGRAAEEVARDNPDELSVFFLDGELHKKRRGQIARYFTPKAMRDRYHPVMVSATESLIADLRKKGSRQLDLISFDLACDVASVIVGLTNSEPRAMALRILAFFKGAREEQGPLQKIFDEMDVMPAVEARRKQRQDDVISLLLDLNYSHDAILSECLTYASAGMMTTREFIVAVSWHLFENAELREKYLNGSEEVQFGILDEILRLDPVVTHIHRRATEDFVTSDGEQVKKGELLAIELRSANLDEAMTGPDPLIVDPERGKRQRMTSAWMSFGDGPHRCPGAQVALHETRIFVDALLRVPGVRMSKPPVPRWTGTAYELHDAIIECDPI
ncbi:MAG TPA: cytochrome P450 [Novosphingobium sp.]